jgi:cytochrome oxidase Cu insertion factor (SCO1/SenC/PrrC family)
MRRLSFVFAILAGIGCGGSAAAHGNNHGAEAARQGPTSAYAFALPEPGSYRLPPIRPAAGGPVLTEKSATTDLATLLRGHITVFSFIYTRCADICPVATAQLAQVRERIRHYPELSRSVRLVSMSFDPDHDTPPVMAEYGAGWRDPGDGGPEWLFVTAPSQAALRPILAAYDQAVARDPDPEDPASGLSHILRVFLIDEAGLVRNIYSMDFLDADLVLTDIRTLVARNSAE